MKRWARRNSFSRWQGLREWRSAGSERKTILRAVGYDLLFRLDQSTFAKNRARSMQRDVAKLHFGQVLAQGAAKPG